MSEDLNFEGLICPACSSTLNEHELDQKIVCPHCKTNLKQKKYLAFLEFLMMQGIVDIDFFDQSLYSVDTTRTVEERELQDETDPEEYENKAERMQYIEEKHDLNEVTTDESEFREWDGLDEDWQEFNKKQNPEGGK
tara:strand:+ start:930 stop:1340 length:411 start_codon:yes stop_codon:yes gene_type:complete